MSFNKKFFTTAGIVASSPSGITNTDNFAPVLYTGNGGTQSISSLDFQPDLVWFKERNGTNAHQLYNSISGDDFALKSNTPDAEYDYSNHPNGDLSPTFLSNGFQTPSVTNNGINRNTGTYVAWCWKAGGVPTPNNNTEGDITSTVSANQEAGFSIVKASLPTNGASNGDTIGHGLDTQPELIIYKATSISLNWYIFSQYGGSLLGSNNVLKFTADAATSDSFFDITPTTFKVGSTNTEHDFIAYCFHSVDSYQKVGSYSGSGSTVTVHTDSNGDGTGTGAFQPRFVMIKRTNTTAADWILYDQVRSGGTDMDDYLTPNSTLVEQQNSAIDITAIPTGFTVESGNWQGINTSGGEYIYLAIA